MKVDKLLKLLVRCRVRGDITPLSACCLFMRECRGGVPRPLYYLQGTQWKYFYSSTTGQIYHYSFITFNYMLPFSQNLMKTVPCKRPGSYIWHITNLSPPAVSEEAARRTVEEIQHRHNSEDQPHTSATSPSPSTSCSQVPAPTQSVATSTTIVPACQKQNAKKT